MCTHVLFQAVEKVNGVETDVNVQSSVTVTITDENNNAPKFDKSEYFVEVSEGLSANNQIPDFHMEVTDDDSVSKIYFSKKVFLQMLKQITSFLI